MFIVKPEMDAMKQSEGEHYLPASAEFLTVISGRIKPGMYNISDENMYCSGYCFNVFRNLHGIR
jgi:hypothetical protein